MKTMIEVVVRTTRTATAAAVAAAVIVDFVQGVSQMEIIVEMEEQ